MSGDVDAALRRLLDQFQRKDVPLGDEVQVAIQGARATGWLEALMALKLITVEEYVEWHARFLEALGVQTDRRGSADA